MRILVIGASGFLGSHVCEVLLLRGHAVLGTSTSRGDLVRLDVSDRQACKTLLHRERLDAVINLAGAGVTAGTASEDQMLRVNFHGAQALSHAIRSVASPPWFVHVSSSTEPKGGAEPESPYSRSKALGTAMLEDSLTRDGVPLAVVRIHNTYGASQPDGRFLMSAMRKLHRGEPFVVQFPHRIRDFCFIEDVGTHLAAVVESPQEGVSHWEIGTGTGTSLWQAGDMVRRRVGAPAHLLGRDVDPRHDPAPVDVASSGDVGFLECETTLHDGLDQVARSAL